MLFLAWFSLILYFISMLATNYNGITKGLSFGQFIVSLLFQSCVLACLIYLVLLL